MILTEKLNVSICASIQAGVEIMKIFKDESLMSINFKDDSSPVTKADLVSNKKITEVLKKFNINILSEEIKNEEYLVRKKWKYLWIVDPLDGTKEFINKRKEFTVNVALVKDNVPILGVVYAPALGELYFAENSLGSYKINDIYSQENLDFSKSIDLSFCKEPDVFTVVASKSHLNEETVIYINEFKNQYDDINVINYGSSLKICKVAEKKANIYPRFGPTMEWDTAAAHAILKYSGGKLIDLKSNKEMLYNKKNLLNNYFIAKL